MDRALVRPLHSLYLDQIDAPRLAAFREPLTMSKPHEIETAEFELLISPSAGDAGAPKPATTTVHVDFGSVSHTGKVRSHNEDHFLVSRFSRKQEILQTNLPQAFLPEQTGDDGYLFIVADGMGGMAAGEVASRLAISTGLKLLQRSERWGFKVNRREARELFNQINRDLQEIDRTLTAQSEADRRLLGMGTTLTAAYSMGVDLFVVHLGDSRAYLHRDGTLRQLTKDHTVAQAMADAGHIAPESVRHHAKRNALTNFLGGHNGKVKADLRWRRLADGDRLLLCSDGLNEMVDDASIARILSQRGTSRDAAQSLLIEALKRGGKDNVTVIVASYQVPKRQPDERHKDQERPILLESTSDPHHPSLAGSSR
jgi:PPM family protein phosphatase